MKTVETRNPAMLPLTRGMPHGADIRRVQEYLCWAAHRLRQPCATAPDGDFGPATQAAVVAFQKAWNIAVTGIVDARTWDLLVAPMKAMARPVAAEASHGATVVAQAMAWLEQRPVELMGLNMGPVVRFAMCRPENRALKPGPEGADFPWCAGTTSTILGLAAEAHGIEPAVPYSWSVPEIGQWAGKSGRLIRGATARAATLKPGMLFLCRGASEWFWPHIGIVARALPDGAIETLEGNTNVGGSANGGEFLRRQRAMASCDYVAVDP